MTGATGTPPTTPTQDTTKVTKSVQGSTGSATEKVLDTKQPAPEKILETNPPTMTASAPRLTSGSQIETATTIPEGTGSSRMGMGGVVEPSQPLTGRVGESGQTTTSNTIIIGSDTSRDQQDLRGQSEGLTETASQYGREMGRRASEAYEQGRHGVSTAAGQAWDTAQRSADEVRRQGSRGLASAQSVLTNNPLVGVAVAAAVGIMVGYLIGRTTTSTRTIGTRLYSDRDEFAESGH